MASRKHSHLFEIVLESRRLRLADRVSSGSVDCLLEGNPKSFVVFIFRESTSVLWRSNWMGAAFCSSPQGIETKDAIRCKERVDCVLRGLDNDRKKSTSCGEHWNGRFDVPESGEVDNQNSFIYWDN